MYSSVAIIVAAVLIVSSEYNGSYPGALKYFIDFWTYPDSFEFRAAAFVGLGGRYGGVRPIEHLQQVFGYRNCFTYPERVFLFNVWSLFKEGKISDATTLNLLRQQVTGFTKFTDALLTSGLHAQTRGKR